MSLPFDISTAPIADGSRVLIEANAGTGKTYNIERLWLRLLLEKQLEPDQILVVTFTEAATAELCDRIRSILAEAAETPPAPPLPPEEAAARSARIAAARAAFDEAAIYTIHGFCKRALSRYAFESGAQFDTELLADDTPIIRETVADFFRAEAARGGIPGTLKFADLVAFAKLVISKPDAETIPPASSISEPIPPSIIDEPDISPHIEEIISKISAIKIEPGASGQSNAGRLNKRLEELWFPIHARRALAFSDLAPLCVFLKGCKGNLPPEAFALKDALAAHQEIFAKIEAWQTAMKDYKTKRDEYLRLRVHDLLRAYLAHPEHGYEARKQRRQISTFDDLLVLMRDALAAGGGASSPLAVSLRKQYRAALIDEFQDTDNVQFQIFDAIFNPPSLQSPAPIFYMIGDPKQAIYAFRNGDIHAYLSAASKVAPDSRFTLSRNFRSDATLVESVNALFRPAGAFIEDGITYEDSVRGAKPMARQLLRHGQPVSQPLQKIQLPPPADGSPLSGTAAGIQIIRETAARIAEMLDPASGWGIRDWGLGAGELNRSIRPLRLSDFAVLVSSHREGLGTQAALLKHGLQSTVCKSGNVFDSKDAAELFHILAAMESPSRATLVKTALLAPHFGATAQSLLALADSELAERQRGFAEHGAVWRAKGVFAALAALAESGPAPCPMLRLAALPGAERKLANFRHLAELLHHAERGQALNPSELLAWLRAQIASADPANEDNTQRMESDGNAVRILTMHASKGLQFPIVFCPFLCVREAAVKKHTLYFTVREAGGDGSAPRQLIPIADEEKKRFKEDKQREILSEDIRLAYVALTRAENFCVYFDAFVKLAAPCALRHILDRAAVENTPSEFADPPPSERRAPAASAPQEELRPPPAPQGRAVDQAILSYSSLASHDAHNTARADAAPPPSGKTDDAIGDDDFAAPAPIPRPRSQVPTLLLPRGKNTGNCIHAILERLDYTRAAPDKTILANAAIRYGLAKRDEDNSEIIDALSRLIAATLAAPLPLSASASAAAPRFSLNQLPPADAIREWEFFAQVPRAIDLEPFRRMGLTFSDGARKGFMTGSIDLVFRRPENGAARYCFADWKSDALPDYAPPALAAAMTEKNYLFQAIVYSAALHVWLRKALPGYDFDAHFGGGYYVFVRGACDTAAASGIYKFAPPRAQVEHWAKLLFNAQ